jgi:hypothetical protein
MDISKSRFKLYNSGGTSLLYTFFAVTYTNAPQSVQDTVEITNLRSKGSIIIDGGEAPFDILMRFHVAGDTYEDIMAEITTLESTIQLNTPYLLRIYKTASTYDQYSIKRLEPFEYAENLRLNFTEINGIFRANSW